MLPVVVPVLVWIHGGGFLYGYKHQSGSPAGLISRSKGGVVYVSLQPHFLIQGLTYL